MDTATDRMIEVERLEDTLVLTARTDLRELEYEEIGVEQREVLQLMRNDPSLRNAVVDFGKTDYFGSSALGLLTRLWRQVRDRGGRMALCHLSAHEEDILGVTGLGGIWPVFPSREEAIRAMAG